MILLLFGPPGSGKGTQSRRLSDWLRIPAISTGDMLRTEAAAETELGRQVRHILKSGGLVPDDLVNLALLERLRRPDCHNGFLLDGYPRTVPQAAYLTRLLEEEPAVRRHPPFPPQVLFLDVPSEVLIRRIRARRQCPDCGRIYNIDLQPPRVADCCDADGSRLVVRPDDDEDVVRERLRAYRSYTEPLLAYYAGENLHRVEATESPDAIFAVLERKFGEILAAINRGANQAGRPIPVGAAWIKAKPRERRTLE